MSLMRYIKSFLNFKTISLTDSPIHVRTLFQTSSFLSPNADDKTPNEGILTCFK